MRSLGRGFEHEHALAAREVAHRPGARVRHRLGGDLVRGLELPRVELEEHGCSGVQVPGRLVGQAADQVAQAREAGRSQPVRGDLR